MRIRGALLAASLAGAVSVLAQAPVPPSSLPRLVVRAGATASPEASWVSLQLPPQVRGADLQLRREDTGETLPLQIGPYREAWALIRGLPPHQDVRFLIEPALRVGGADRVIAGRDVSQVRVSVDGRPAFTYVGEPGPLPGGVDDRSVRGGYIHPVFTPAGRRVTEDAPPGARDHHGIWAAWARTRVDGRSPDFWAMEDGTGAVEFERLSRTWSGPLTAGFGTRHRYMDLSAPTPTTILLEDWRVVAYAWPAGARPLHVFDIEITQLRVGTTPLEVLPSRHGGLGVRGRHQWEGGAGFLTSAGRGRMDGPGTRATWAAMSGTLGGHRVGLALLSHPDNVHAPQPVGIDRHAPWFAFTPQQASAFSVRPGAPMPLRYRVVVMDGAPDAAELDALWQGYASPVRARVE